VGIALYILIERPPLPRCPDGKTVFVIVPFADLQATGVRCRWILARNLLSRNLKKDNGGSAVKGFRRSFAGKDQRLAPRRHEP
jgi:hypothetical protein